MNRSRYIQEESSLTLGTLHVVKERTKFETSVLLVVLVSLALAIPSVTTFWIVNPSL